MPVILLIQLLRVFYSVHADILIVDLKKTHQCLVNQSHSLNLWTCHHCIFINKEGSFPPSPKPSLQLSVCLFPGKMATTDPTPEDSTSMNELGSAQHYPNSRSSNPCSLWKVFQEHYPSGFLRKVHHKLIFICIHTWVIWYIYPSGFSYFGNFMFLSSFLGIIQS